MKVKLPIIGQVRTGADAVEKAAGVTTIKMPTAKSPDKEKLFDLLGGILDISRRGLSTEKTVSSRVLEANKEWVYRNNDVIAQEVSAIDFQLFQLGLSKGEIVYTEIEEHPLLALLDKFNATTPKADGMYNTQSHKKLTGDAFWLLKSNGNQITDIYILQPDKVTLDLGDPSRGEPLVKAYKYEDVIDGKKVVVTYKPEEIIHFKKPNPSNPYRGKGAVEAAAETIDSDNLANLTQKNFFKRGAITNFVLSTAGKVTDDQLKRLKADLKSNNAGADNAFELMILSGGLKPVNVSLSNRELQLIDLLTWYRDKIMVEFGNTPASLGIIEDVNQANANATLAAWKRGTVKPDMDAIVNTLNEFLVPRFGKNLVLGYVNVVPEDRTDDVEEAAKLKNAGIITINEARVLLGYDNVTGGDIFAPQGIVDTPSEFTTAPPKPKPLPDDEDPVEESIGKRRSILRAAGRLYDAKMGKLPASLAHIDMRPILRRRGLYVMKNYNHALRESAKPMIRKLIAAGKTEAEAIAEAEEQRITPHFTNDVVMEFYTKQIHTVEVLEGQFEKAIVKFIKSMEDQALVKFDTQLENKSQKAAIAYLKKQEFDLFDEEAIKTQAQIDLTPILMNQVVVAGQAAYDLIGKEDVYIPFNVVDTVRGNVAKFTQSMLDTDREALSKLIIDGIGEGLSVPQIRSGITAKFEDISKNQSTRITRTEVMRASNMGNLDAYDQSGVVEAKQWLAAGATDECADLDGEVVTLSTNFYGSENEFQNGDPPLHPNCRCVVIPIVTESDEAKQPSVSDVQDFQDDEVID